MCSQITRRWFFQRHCLFQDHAAVVVLHEFIDIRTSGFRYNCRWRSQYKIDVNSTGHLKVETGYSKQRFLFVFVSFCSFFFLFFFFSFSLHIFCSLKKTFLLEVGKENKPNITSETTQRDAWIIYKILFTFSSSKCIATSSDHWSHEENGQWRRIEITAMSKVAYDHFRDWRLLWVKEIGFPTKTFFSFFFLSRKDASPCQT